MAVLLTAKQLAELRGCTTAAVYKSYLPRLTDGKQYDLSDPQVRDWVYDPYIKERIRSEKISSQSDLEDKGSQELVDEKLRQDIEYRKKQSRGLDLKHETEKRNLVPADLMRLWIGYFAAGIRNNILQIGNRVARGDIKLRDKIEAETKRAIEKTLQSAEAQLRAEGENIKLTLGGESEEGTDKTNKRKRKK